MTSPERMSALCKAVEYIISAGIQGDFVECGVWRGGSMMAVALTLLHLEQQNRDLYLFDTFQGMPPPNEVDIDINGIAAHRLLAEAADDKSRQIWALAGLQEVRDNMRLTSYPEQLIHYVPGRVEETLPSQAPPAIALLRLDTDWYESTAHELNTLWDRLAIGGVLMIDDYGQWRGARRAVDEFVARLPGSLYLSRIDYTGRIGIKVR
jgi:hypothetical protein